MKKLLVFVIIASLIAFFPLRLISTYSHELAHVNTAEEHNINLTMNLKDHFFTIQGTGGRANFNTNRDEEAFNSSGKEAKADVLLAGVKSDFKFMYFIAILILAILMILKFINLKRIREKIKDINAVNSILNIILLALVIWLLLLITSTQGNLFAQGYDLQRLVSII